MDLDPEEMKNVELQKQDIEKSVSDIFILEKYKTLRAYIEHEDSLLNFRMTWFLTSQGVTGTAYAILLHQELDPLSNKSTINTITSLVIICVICLVGFMISILSYKSIKSAVDATVSVRKFITDEELERLRLPELTSGGSKSSLKHGSTLSLGLPKLTTGLWPILFALFVAIVIAKTSSLLGANP